jgi:LPXTG-site transpeptidase (sortase) family protein
MTDTAWYKDGSRPGQAGNAVFAGHVNNALTTSGVFGHLNQVHLGDYVTVADQEGKTLVYKVTALDQYPADEAPVASIFAKTGPSQLVLITCDGEWVPAEKTFDKRLVITASPAFR